MTDEMQDEEALDGAVDTKQANADIAAGARALKELKRTAGHNWTQWSAAVRGWRAIRELAFKRAGTRDMKTQAYRDAMTMQLGLVKNFEYRDIQKETRSAMTKLIQHIDEIDGWHATLSVWDRERWTNPQTVLKHCPAHMRVGLTHNKPKPDRKPPKKKKGNPEAEGLRAILVRVIEKYVRPVDPAEASALLEKLYEFDGFEPRGPDDGLDDLGLGDEEAA